MGPYARIARLIAHEAKEILAETLWPTRCAICDSPGAVLCDACAGRLPYIDATKACPLCGAPFGIIQCTECATATLALHGRESFPLDAMAHCVSINEDAKRIVTVFKDHDELRLGAVLGILLARYMPPAWMEGSPTLTFIPASKEALRRRGFDHGEIMARAVAVRTGIALQHTLNRPTHRDQRRLSRKGRVGNLDHTFTVKEGTTLSGSVIIVDDICTTGATLYGAADALRDAGCERVFGLTFGHVLE